MGLGFSLVLPVRVGLVLVISANWCFLGLCFLIWFGVLALFGLLCGFLGWVLGIWFFGLFGVSRDGCD